MPNATAATPADLATAAAVLSVALPFRRGGAAAGLPQRIKILGWGENVGRTTGARILVDDAVAETLSANQELVACDRIPLDYEHQSVKGHPNYLPDPRLSPGSGVVEVVPGEGVFLSAITYTANGETHADSYQDVSAVVHLDRAGRPLWVSSVALTQKGDVAGMELAEAIAALSAAEPSKSTPAPAKKIMNSDQNQFRALCISLLGLPAGESGPITDDEILAAAEAKTAAMSADPEKVADTTAVLSAMSERMDATDRKLLLAEAALAGKVIPLSAEMVNQTPIAVLSALIDKLTPGEVPFTVRGGVEKPAARVAALSADESRAARSLGLTDDEYRASKPATA